MPTAYSEVTKEAIAHSLQELESRIDALTTALAHESVWIHAEGGRGREGMVRRACEAIWQIGYQMDDEAGTTVNCLAVIGVSTEMIKTAQSVNQAKLKLQEMCSPLKDVRVRVPVKGGGTKAIPAIRVLLRNIQRSDLNLVAAYRKIPILGALPASITYTEAMTRPVRRKTVEEIYAQLQFREGPQAIEDRGRLESLPRGVKHLALVREHYTNIRANVRFQRLDARGRGRMQCAAELPLLFALRSKDEVPEVSFPKTSPPAAAPRRIRAQLIEEHPFLETLPVYRYLTD